MTSTYLSSKSGSGMMYSLARVWGMLHQLYVEYGTSKGVVEELKM